MTAMIAMGLASWTLIVGLQPAVNFWRAWTFADGGRALRSECAPS